MTFRFILRWSKYPPNMLISRNINSYNYRKEWYVKDCCFYELMLFKYGCNKICTNIHVFWIYFMGIYANIGFQTALIHRPHDGHLDFFLHVQKYSSPWLISLDLLEMCFYDFYLNCLEVPKFLIFTTLSQFKVFDCNFEENLTL